MAKEVVKVSPETREAYEAPKCEVMELQMEGVLCGSDGGGGWVNEDGDGYPSKDPHVRRR